LTGYTRNCLGAMQMEVEGIVNDDVIFEEVTGSCAESKRRDGSILYERAGFVVLEKPLFLGRLYFPGVTKPPKSLLLAVQNDMGVFKGVPLGAITTVPSCVSSIKASPGHCCSDYWKLFDSWVDHCLVKDPYPDRSYVTRSQWLLYLRCAYLRYMAGCPRQGHPLLPPADCAIPLNMISLFRSRGASFGIEGMLDCCFKKKQPVFAKLNIKSKVGSAVKAERVSNFEQCHLDVVTFDPHYVLLHEIPFTFTDAANDGDSFHLIARGRCACGKRGHSRGSSPPDLLEILD